MVPMRDGTLLSADVYRPLENGPHPVLVMRVPYSKSLAQTVVYAHPCWYASRGYIVVVQDTRGRFASQGSFSPWVEGPDSYDTVEWAATLKGANGRVGMYGFSYAGALQLQAATLRPPHLCAIAPAFTSLDLYNDWIYPGGALSWAFIASWGAGDWAAETARRSGDAELFERLKRVADVLPRAYGDLPIADYAYLPPVAAPFFHEWLSHPTADGYWTLPEADALHAITVPGLHIGGWSDVFIEGTLRRTLRWPTALQPSSSSSSGHGCTCPGRDVPGQALPRKPATTTSTRCSCRSSTAGWGHPPKRVSSKPPATGPSICSAWGMVSGSTASDGQRLQ